MTKDIYIDTKYIYIDNIYFTDGLAFHIYIWYLTLVYEETCLYQCQNVSFHWLPGSLTAHAEPAQSDHGTTERVSRAVGDLGDLGALGVPGKWRNGGETVGVSNFTIWSMDVYRYLWYVDGILMVYWWYIDGILMVCGLLHWLIAHIFVHLYQKIFLYDQKRIDIIHLHTWYMYIYTYTHHTSGFERIFRHGL